VNIHQIQLVSENKVNMPVFKPKLITVLGNEIS